MKAIRTTAVTSVQQTPTNRNLRMMALTVIAMMSLAGSLHADLLHLPNFSFESQVTAFADPRIDYWQKPPQPGTYDTNVFGAWDNLAGLFGNPPATNAEHIDNADGNQLAYLFAYPQMAIFQDFNSTDWANGAPSHAFNATYKPGKSYRLTVGLTTSAEEPLAQGARLQLSLYYRDGSSNMVTVAATTVMFDTNVFTNITLLVDFHVNVPAVTTNDAWAGQNIGIQIMCADTNVLGGVWDLDNVRLTEDIGVPNFSFESQVTPFANPHIDFWQKPPQPPPAFYDTNIFGPWDNLAGLFGNPPATNAEHIDNADGAQLAYLFAYPQMAIFQDFNSIDWSNAAPTHAFNAKFNPGKSYTLAVGLTTSAEEPLAPGATLQLSLYYRDASSNMVTVAATTVTFNTNVFTNITHLIDFQVNTPTVRTNDAWAGRNIGIQIQCADTNFFGGVWDMDNVRLTEDIGVPNFSFESQVTPFADPRIDFWQKPPQPPPAFFDTNVFGAWDNLAGLFGNPPATNAEHIDNADGAQLAYLFAYPQMALFQDFNSTDWVNLTPSHAFNVTFKPGKSYTLTVGLTTSSEEPLTQGSTLQLSLYYRDVSNNMVTVAATSVVYDTNVFTNSTHLIDFNAALPEVQAGDPFAGKNIGIQLMSTVAPNLIGGIWDIDNVRLTETVAKALRNPVRANGHLSFTLQSEPGLAFEIQASTNLATTNWTGIATITNVTGAYLFTDTATNLNQRFYRARGL